MTLKRAGRHSQKEPSAKSVILCFLLTVFCVISSSCLRSTDDNSQESTSPQSGSHAQKDLRKDISVSFSLLETDNTVTAVVEVEYTGMGNCIIQDAPKIVIDYDINGIIPQPIIEGMSIGSLDNKTFPKKLLLLYGKKNKQSGVKNGKVVFTRKLERLKGEISNGVVKCSVTINCITSFSLSSGEITTIELPFSAEKRVARP